MVLFFISAKQNTAMFCYSAMKNMGMLFELSFNVNVILGGKMVQHFNNAIC